MNADPDPLPLWPRSIEIVDCHHHLWDLSANYYPWLTDRVTARVCGEYSAIRRNYLLTDFRRDAADVNLVQSVHVEAVPDPADPVRETRWLQRIADDPASDGFPHGIVAFCDLSRLDAADVLEAHRQSANLRGVRQMLHEPLLDPAMPGRSLLTHEAWWRNFGLLGKHGLSFELQVFPRQMAEALPLVRAFPDTQFVLCHTGQPGDRTPEGLELWRSGLRSLAACPNLAVKISGLGMFDRAWTVESLRPIVRDTIAIFGVERCLFASNFPVDGMMSGYGRLWRAYLEIVADFTRSEQQALFAGNARRVYRLPIPPLPVLPLFSHDQLSNPHTAR